METTATSAPGGESWSSYQIVKAVYMLGTVLMLAHTPSEGQTDQNVLNNLRYQQ